MVRPAQERVLLIGDVGRQLQAALLQAMPAAQVRSVDTLFEGIALLGMEQFTTVLTAAEPLERRPEAAVQTLRELGGEARLILFGQPSLEPLSRKMLRFGCDDYLVTPLQADEIKQVLGRPPIRGVHGSAPAEAEMTDSGSASAMQQSLPWIELFLETLWQHPHDPTTALLERINEVIGPALRLEAGPEAPSAPDGQKVVSCPLHHATGGRMLHLTLPQDEDSNSARHLLSQLVSLVDKVQALQERQLGLQRLAVTDELTGLYNSRYFRLAVSRLLEKAQVMRFPVTLLMFDLDDFKRYNDEYGHAVGDQVLKQTAALMKRCCREHDVVGRLGGDEFAVVFWEKEGPRLPRNAKPGQPVAPAPPPKSVVQIIERFQKLIASQTIEGLGSSGTGVLTVSGGLAQFPYDGRSLDELLSAADKGMRNAKKGGKDNLVLIGGNLPAGDRYAPHEDRT